MDVTSAALQAVAARNIWAPPLAFAAGVAVSIGPCVASRLVTVAALTLNKTPREVWRVLIAFIAGLVAAYSVLAVGGSLLWQMFRYSGYIYLAAATAMGVAGLTMLLRKDRVCEHRSDGRQYRSNGAIFLLGASSAATMSPCCVPIVAASIAYASTTGLVFAWMTISCFALGHAAPLAIVATSSRAIGAGLSNASFQSATRVIGGALMLALAGFYGVVA